MYFKGIWIDRGVCGEQWLSSHMDSVFLAQKYYVYILNFHKDNIR